MEPTSASRLDTVMTLLHVSALELSRHCGISNSLISRWQRGVRPLPKKEDTLRALAAALHRLDSGGLLDGLLTPFRAAGEGRAEALALYLAGEDLPGLPERAAPPEIPYSGEYIIRQRVLLGEWGFRRGALLMIDYLLRLPPGQHVTVCAHDITGLWHGNLPFALQFLQKTARAAGRGATFTLISRVAPALHGSPFFSLFWLKIHLQGMVRSRYYRGRPPAERFVASIPGYWSARVKRDETAEDGVLCVLFSDPRSIREDAAHCEAYLKRSLPASQYGFLRCPQGDADNRRLWQPGPLPRWEGRAAPPPSGCFSAICRTPSLGVMTREDLSGLLAGDAPPPLPDHLFIERASFAPGPHRIILCREDVREGLLAGRRNEPLSRLLHRDVLVPSAMLAAQLGRVLRAMEGDAAFEVALMPRSAFEKLEIELIYWENSAMIGWLQSGGESLYDCNAITAASFSSAVGYAWERLRKGWKRRETILRTLRKWLAGEGLDKPEADSAIVRNWTLLPEAAEEDDA